MTATHYNGSKGPVPIASMNPHHLASAHAKLLRERVGNERQDEIDAMAARLAEIEGEDAEDENPRVAMGDNQPPEPTTFEAVKTHMDDLLTEARNWADGQAVENQAQADDISRLIEDLRLAGNAADEARVAEKKPLDEQIDEIQTRYNAYIAGMKAKVKTPGKVTVAIDALKAALHPYLAKLKAEQDAIAEAARKTAEEAAQKDADAARAASVDDLAAREEADALVAEAASLLSVAKRAEAEKPQAHGGSKALGLTKTYTPVMTDKRAAILHYMASHPDDFVALAQRLAVIDVREGKRTIPGFDVQEGTKL